MKPIIIANWKMNLTIAESAKKAKFLVKEFKKLEEQEVVICPSFSALYLVKEEIKKSPLKLGAQDIFWEDLGAYTGEESPKVLRELGCDYAIVGHSERRQNLIESDEMIHRKIKSALGNSLTPVLCVGETFEERQEGQTGNVIFYQLVRALTGIDLIPSEQLVIAYEPVWVIGSGRAIEPAEAEEAFKLIYHTILDFWPASIIKNNVRIIYGGSVDSGNVKSFIGLEHFAGLLVGGSSLKEEELVKIIRSF